MSLFSTLAFKLVFVLFFSYSCSNYQRTTLLILFHRKHTMLEYELQPTPQIQEEQRDFCLGHGTVKQIFVLAEMLQGGGSLIYKPTCIFCKSLFP